MPTFEEVSKIWDELERTSPEEFENDPEFKGLTGRLLCSYQLLLTDMARI